MTLKNIFVTLGLFGTLPFLLANNWKTPIEVKASIDVDSFESNIFRLKEELPRPLQRQIFFFDTPTQELFQKGIILRARVSEDQSYDSTVKFRPLSAEDLNGDWLKQEGFKCEIDQTFRSETSSCSYTHDDNELPSSFSIKKLLSKKQEMFFEKQSGEKFVSENIMSFGPIYSTTYKKISYHQINFSLEIWQVRNQRFIEISVKGTLEQENELKQVVRDFIQEYQFIEDPAGNQKTTRALQLLKQENN